MTDKEILDFFGEKIITQILDRYYLWIPKEINTGLTNPNKTQYNEVFDELKNYILEHLNSFLFDILGFFEENEEFKLIFKSDGKQVDLVKISEMLKAEPIIEGGWIDRFSQFSDKRNEEDK